MNGNQKGNHSPYRGVCKPQIWEKRFDNNKEKTLLENLRSIERELMDAGWAAVPEEYEKILKNLKNQIEECTPPTKAANQFLDHIKQVGVSIFKTIDTSKDGIQIITVQYVHTEEIN